MRGDDVDRLIGESLYRDAGLAALLPTDPAQARLKVVATLKFLGSLAERDFNPVRLKSITRLHHSLGVRERSLLELFSGKFVLLCEQVCGRYFAADEHAVWQQVFARTLAAMNQCLDELDSEADNDSGEDDFLQQLGGRAVIDAVHRRLYDRLFDDAWIGQFFYGKSKTALVRKQTEFTLHYFGALADYTSEPPQRLHMHMYIDEEMFDIRHDYLKRSIEEEGVQESLKLLWLDFDESFRPSITKAGVETCVMRCPGQMPIVPRKPQDYSPL
ncbi:group 1 truncated hemoglobin [Mangrovimicrobium sediminis]|uniref:Group 1 truncated hemoglobin n=1 Tax=Mangrovimicrobium sediminis TaxID=2562682 RepID=A0A4Z0LZF6_9GAMM|nr:group 1 truncated hemoglobin [Haliea sp. SAOS-164]TGD72649.1 group 1 truncated hemoglobin [Haliea sp. SAOS-164]